MFDALKGLKEALAAKERILEERKILASDAIEELNNALTALTPSNIITVVYYCDYEHQYRQLTGAVAKVDTYWRPLQVGDVCIYFEDIYEITS